ncbi:MAG: hypothetical protein ACI94Y_003429 [Maribacter sp.]|jgi:uncharacterized protein (TIGR02452 family)
MKKSKRRVIAQETLAILQKGYYKNKEGKEISISKWQKAAEKGTILYTPDILLELIEQPLESKDIETIYKVNDLTTLDSARQECQDSEKLIYLNFASARNPGGGFLKGSEAQEESIARATGLYPCQLKSEKYYKTNRRHKSCLYTDHIIYSPLVPIIKDEKGEPMDEAIRASIITAPAVNTGVVLRNEPDNIENIAPFMKRRIDMILAICQKGGYDTLILGAWGCGVFQNDPAVIASMFKEKLEGKYKNQFKKVVFSIYAREERFIKPFRMEFGN